MRCEACHGIGGAFDLMGNPTICGVCHGSGVASCCDGSVRTDPYDDPSYPERECDFCGNPYRGPAVYCSLECSTADA